jgi:hypothetical protein
MNVPAVLEATPAAAILREKGEQAARQIISQWKGPNFIDACAAALHLGFLNSGNLLNYSRCRHLLEVNLARLKVDEERWPEVLSSFHQGRDTIITRSEVWARFLPKASNDNGVLFDPSPFIWREPKAIPPRDWIYGRHLLRRHVSATIASGAVGKTSLKIVEALALATGRDLLGQEVPKRARVWLYNLEDDRDEIDRRVIAAMIRYRIKPEDVADYLFVEGETPLVITMTDRNGTKIRQPVVGGLIDAIKRRAVDVLIVDPFVSSHDAPESDNGAMDLIVKHGWVNVAREAECAIDICHHTTKSDATSGMATAMSARGGGSFIAACRSVQVLNPMSVDDAQKAGLPTNVGYFSSFGDKQNLTPKTGTRDWYKMESVDLGNGGNGNLAFMQSDNIGVVTQWEWPTDKSFVEGVTADQLQAIKNRLYLGEYRESDQAKEWAGDVVAEVLGMDVSDKAEKARVVKMLKTWIKEGHLEVYKKNDANRIPRDFIRTQGCITCITLGDASVV